ncbi:MAG: YwaF family protein [Clostridia bacterium]|nr:YwaF family protein [Clostridia bacterium]
MSLLEKIIRVFEYKVTPPEVFGVYHICCLVIVAVAAVLLVWRFKDASDKTIRKVLLTVWCVIALLELIKQLEGAYFIDEYGQPTWSYLWHSFPLQFCSTPYYCLPFIVFLPDGFWRRSFIAFFASFSLFAGLVVMIYPGDVYCTTLFLNVQTMIHHGAMVSLGVLMVAHSRRQMNKRYFLGSLLIFYAFAAVALLLNELLYYFVLVDLPSEAVNLFFISRHYDSTLPLLSDVYRAVPYGVYLAVYFVGFTLASALIYFAEKGILALAKKCTRAR